MSNYLPPQHAAWAFPGLPLILGVIVATVTPLTLVVTVAGVAACPLSYAVLGLVRARPAFTSRPVRSRRNTSLRVSQPLRFVTARVPSSARAECGPASGITPILLHAAAPAGPDVVGDPPDALTAWLEPAAGDVITVRTCAHEAGGQPAVTGHLG